MESKDRYTSKSPDFNDKMQDSAEHPEPNLAYSGKRERQTPNMAYASNASSIEPIFSGYMQTSLGYARYGSKYGGFKEPNPQSPVATQSRGGNK